MSTRATIACRHDDGRYAAISLHFDGYPEHTGKVLNEHYNNQTAARSLVDGGDLRSFDEATGTAERHSDGNPPAIMPTHASLLTFARNCSTEFLYVFENGEWSFHTLRG